MNVPDPKSNSPAYPGRVHLVEVGPRDGLQNESRVLPVGVRVRLIKNLLAAGLKTIEAGSFVSARWVPQMAGTAEVLASLPDEPGVSFPVLVPNLEGLDRARRAGARSIAVFAAATESFSNANLNASRADAMARFAAVIRSATAAGIRIRGYVSCAVHCPYEGWVDPVEVADIASKLMHLGCYEVSLCDTTGHATPERSAAMAEAAIAAVSREHVAVHFHDTKGRALENTEACLRLGIATVDSSVAGLGGCPYSPGAAGNLATEKLVGRLHSLGIETGVDPGLLGLAGVEISSELAPRHDLPDGSGVQPVVGRC